MDVSFRHVLQKTTETCITKVCNPNSQAMFIHITSRWMFYEYDIILTMLISDQCFILTPDPAKHAIPKTVEVTYSIGMDELDWQYGARLKSHGTVTNLCTGREWPVSAWWRSNMPFQRQRKYIFRWPVMGRDWVGVELLYNSVHRKFKEFGDQKSWRNDAVEKTAPSRELGSRASGWGTLENEKDTLLCPEELGRSKCSNSVPSPTPFHI